MRPQRIFISISVIFLLTLPTWIVSRAGDNLLFIAREGTDGLALDWSGPGPAWKIYADNAPQNVDDPSNEVDQTFDPWTNITMSSDPLEFFLVESQCMSGFPEECDGFDNDCDTEVDEDFYDPIGQHILRAEHCGECGNSCGDWGACLLHPDCTGTPVPTCTSYANPCIGLECDEACDNVDNDQDCDVDEDFKDPTGQYYVHDDACGGCGMPCNLAVDPTFNCQLVDDCLGSPYPACVGDSTCIGAGCPEICDGIDNDLNCLVDDGFRDSEGLYITDEHCGQCYNDCTLLSFGGLPGVCYWQPWWGEAGLHTGPVCSTDCTGSCFDVNGNPVDSCECCDPLPFEGCGDPALFDSDCDGPDPYDTDCDDWPMPLPYVQYCCTYGGPPLTMLVGCDGVAGAQGDAIVLFELDVDGDLVYDHSDSQPVFVEHTFTGSGHFPVYCRVTDSGARSMYFFKEVSTDGSSGIYGCHQECYSP